MEGLEISKLMLDKGLKGLLAKHSRRYSSCIEDQEEYIQDAWIRIATLKADMAQEYYGEQGRKAIVTAYWKRRRRRVSNKNGKNANGISVTEKDEKKKMPARAVRLARNKYFDPKPEILDWQYYKGQEEDIQAKVNQEIEWYKKYEGYESLTRREQKSVENRFRSSGYIVGKPIGGTFGKKSRHYKIMIDYAVINGVVEPIRVPHVKDNATRVVGGGATPVILATWHALRKLGGKKEWTEWLDETIAEFESLLNS